MIKYGSRKFLVTIGVIASATWLVYTEHIADGVYSAVIIAVVVAYMGANVAQKATVKALDQIAGSTKILEIIPVTAMI